MFTRAARHHRWQQGGAVLMAAAVALAAVVLAAGPAAARGEDVWLRVVEQEADGGDVRFVFRMVHKADESPAPGIRTVVLSAEGPDGATVGPVEVEAVEPDQGLYGTTVTFPASGRWDLTVAAEDDDTELRIRHFVDLSATTTTSPSPSTSVATDPVRLDREDGVWRQRTLVGLVAVVVTVVGGLLVRRSPASSA